MKKQTITDPTEVTEIIANLLGPVLASGHSSIRVLLRESNDQLKGRRKAAKTPEKRDIIMVSV